MQLMGICCEFIEINSTKPHVQRVRGLSTESVDFMLKEGESSLQCAQITYYYYNDYKIVIIL
jgi:hypothetical protein